MSKGSAKHILDYLSDDKKFNIFSMKLAAKGIDISFEGSRRPVNESNSNEYHILTFLEEYHGDVTGTEKMKDWWAVSGKKSTWDLLSNCNIDGKPGILLVEAKAHERELHYYGKSKSSAKNQKVAKKNTKIIKDCIIEAKSALNKVGQGRFNISIGSHYQLSNRFADAWKLASVGYNIVLVYLGFIGDQHFHDFLTNSEHWERVMGAYMHKVIPLSIPDKTICIEAGGSLRMIIMSLDVVE